MEPSEGTRDGGTPGTVLETPHTVWGRCDFKRLVIPSLRKTFLFLW